MADKIIKEGFERRKVYTNLRPSSERPIPNSNQPTSDQSGQQGSSGQENSSESSSNSNE